MSQGPEAFCVLPIGPATPACFLHGPPSRAQEIKSLACEAPGTLWGSFTPPERCGFFPCQ